MPKVAQIKEEKRDKIQAQDSYRWTTPDLRVAARDVQTDVPRAGMSGNTQAFLSVLDNVSGIIPKGAELYGQHLEDKGVAAAVAGKELEENPAERTVRAYNTVTAKADVGKFKSELAEYNAKNWNTDTVTYQKGMEQIYNKYMHQKPESYMKNFFMPAQGALNEFASKQKVYQVQMAQEDFIGKMGGDLDEFLTETKGGNEVFPDMDALSGSLRAFVTQYQTQAKYMGIDKQRVTDAIVKKVARLAVKERDMGVMKFLFKKNKDIKLFNTGNVSGVYEATENAVYRASREALALEKVAITERRTALSLALTNRVWDIKEGKSKETWDDIDDYIRQPETMLAIGDAKLAAIRKTISEIKSGVNTKDNPAVVMQLRKSIYGSPQYRPEQSALDGARARGELTDGTYTSMSNTLSSMSRHGWDDAYEFKAAEETIKRTFPRQRSAAAIWDKYGTTETGEPDYQDHIMMDFKDAVANGDLKSSREIPGLLSEMLEKWKRDKPEEPKDAPTSLPERLNTVEEIRQALIQRDGSGDLGFSFTNGDVVDALSVIYDRPVTWAEALDILAPPEEVYTPQAQTAAQAKVGPDYMGPTPVPEDNALQDEYARVVKARADQAKVGRDYMGPTPIPKDNALQNEYARVVKANPIKPVK